MDDAIFEVIFAARIGEDAGEGGIDDRVVVGNDHATDGCADVLGVCKSDAPQVLKFGGPEDGLRVEVDFPSAGMRSAMGAAEAIFGFAEVLFGAEALGDFGLEALAGTVVGGAEGDD
jgi:hypothetical protein